MMFVFLVLISHIMQTIATTCPNASRCVCDEEKHYAKCTNLLVIPVLPSYVTSLDFSRNFLRHLQRSTFTALEALKLENLSLANDYIFGANSDSLNDLLYLRSLDLSRNPMILSVAVTAIMSIRSPFFSTLIINMNPWKFIGIGSTLNALCTAFNLTHVSLRYSYVPSLSFNEMSKCVVLQFFDVSKGHIQSLEPGFLKHIKELNLQNNGITLKRGGFFGKKSTCSFPEIEILRLENNRIMNLDNRLSCLDKLRILILDNNPLMQISTNTFINLPSLSHLSIANLSDGLNTVKSLAFGSTSLNSLNFSGNKFMFKSLLSNIYFDKYNIFKLVPNLAELDLSGNIFDTSDVLTIMLLPAKLLKKLWLKNCGISTLPTGLFSNMPHLQEFVASYNNISAWDGNIVFGDYLKLKTLKLDSNSLSIVDESFFLLRTLNQLTAIDLRSNPFLCTCENLWFRNLIKQRTSLFTDVPFGYRCFLSPYKVTYLTDYNPTYSECYNVFLIMSLAQDSSEFVYDAFVIYCDSDRSWVRTQLIDKVEKISGLNLCIHHRDFKAGQLIIDNIAENIAASRKILLLMSRDMLRSDWCLFEMRIAQERFLNKETDTMIVVMLETVSKDLMSPSLRFLINSTTYIEWPRKQYEEERLWNEVLRALQ
ncbi:toll-like receptor 13 [Mytilus edulis]|uniref:toll-like receptor 13 n=1 Tax=Mytilus edulis TaxID=6550 RepID=UPI0039EFDD9B